MEASHKSSSLIPMTQGLKPSHKFVSFGAAEAVPLPNRLMPSFSATCKAVPFQNRVYEISLHA